MSDIVNMLRVCSVDVVYINRQAAAEIERLEARVKELEKEFAVRWRPISEAPPYRHVIVWVPASAGRNGHIRHSTIWCVDENKWVDANWDVVEVQPTHFIPISALGEPNND